MRYYKDKYEIPLFNWIMITESGMDFSYLLTKKTKLTERKRKILNNKYMEILNTLKNTNTELLEKYVRWMGLLTMHRIEVQRKKLGKLVNKTHDFNIKDLEKAFREYLIEVEKIYMSFEFTEYYFDPDYKNLYIGIFGQESYDKYSHLIEKFEPIKFYTWDEYALFIEQFPEILPLTLHDNFKKMFIKTRQITIDSIIDMDTYLMDIYSAAKLYDEYQFVRAGMFDINLMKSDTKAKPDPFAQVAAISELMGFHINTKETTLAEYEQIEIRAKQKAERSQEQPKPQADDGRL